MREDWHVDPDTKTPMGGLFLRHPLIAILLFPAQKLVGHMAREQLSVVLAWRLNPGQGIMHIGGRDGVGLGLLSPLLPCSAARHHTIMQAITLPANGNAVPEPDNHYPIRWPRDNPERGSVASAVHDWR